MTLIEVDKVHANESEIASNHEAAYLIREHRIDPDNESTLIDDIGFARGIGNSCSSAPRTDGSGTQKSSIREPNNGIANLVGKLENFFDLSKKKQRKKHHKLLKIIDKLEKKQDSLQISMEQEFDSKRYHDLIRKFDVICDLIRKAKLKDRYY